MKTLLTILYIGMAFLGAVAAGNAQELLTFDDLSTVPPGPGEPGEGFVPNSYGGLYWINFGVLDGLKAEPGYGYYTGVVSPSDVAFNEFGNPASVSSSGLFDLDSAYLTAALNLGTTLNVQVQGFVGATMLYNNTYTVNNSGPTLIHFDYNGVDIVTFTSSPSQQFAMDNLTVTVPEPSTLTLIGMGLVIPFFFIRRRKTNTVF